jgi:biotin carboxyl carrier protein
MKFEVHVGGRRRMVELERNGESWHVSLDGSAIDAHPAQIAPNVFSVLLNGQSYEVRVSPVADGTLNLRTSTAEFAAEVVDPRVWRGRRHGPLEAEGRQQITAPMPGKVVRVLVEPGASVQTGQGLIVVEAMKMQNEIRSPKTGKIERLFAREGQAVDAGEILAVVS